MCKLEGLGSEFPIDLQRRRSRLVPPGASARAMHNVLKCRGGQRPSALYLNVPGRPDPGKASPSFCRQVWPAALTLKGVVKWTSPSSNDYGHHPGPKFRAHPRSGPRLQVQSPARGLLPSPHRYYTHPSIFWDEFCPRRSNQADILVVLDIYAASEAPIPGRGPAKRLATAIRDAGQ